MPQILGQPGFDSHYGALKTAADATTVTFDLLVADKHQVTLGGNRTLALANDQGAQTFLIILNQDSTGNCTVTWWTGIRWPGGTVPTLMTTPNKSALFVFVRLGSGAYLGFVGGRNL